MNIRTAFWLFDGFLLSLMVGLIWLYVWIRKKSRGV